MATAPKLALHTLPPECTVSTEAIESSSNGGSMARKRYQKGFVYLDGDKWKGRYREDLITGEGTKHGPPRWGGYVTLKLCQRPTELGDVGQAELGAVRISLTTWLGS